MTAGEGKFSFGFRMLARSGAEAGGGTTALPSWAGRVKGSRLTPVGAAGMMVAASSGVERFRSEVTLGAGATGDVLSDGAMSVRSRETVGAGGITAGPNAGATRVWPL